DIGIDPSIITVQYYSATQIGIIRVNGVFIDSSFCPRNNDSTIYLSTYTSAGGNNFIGDINEVILYDKVINKRDLDETENYLFKKYNILKPISPSLPDPNILLFPKSKQFFCRDSNDSCLVPVKGKIINTGFDSVYLGIYKNGNLISKISNKIIYENNKSVYLFLPKIHSELSEYKFVLGIKSKLQDSIIFISDSIVCGDFYIISGQSNTIFGGNNYSNEFCRTFGKNYSLKKSDTLWSVANGSGSGGGPDIGAWGMRLSQLILEKYKIPICIINGGVGGTTIEQNQRNDLNPLDPTNIYNSINYRVEKSGLRKFVKAIFWYQGESNSSTGYYLGMKALYQDWQVDYSSLKKIYIMQIHHGCSSDGSAVREVQRTIKDSLPNIEVLSPHGVPFHDGCHYALAGYIILADRIFGVVERDFYNSIDTVSISSPNIKKAFYTTDSHNEIKLIFSPQRNGLYLQADTLNQSIKDYFYFGLEKSYGNVESVIASEDTIILKLKTPSNAQLLSYTPDQFYNNTQITFEGPYIKNKKGIGSLTFNLFPIVDKNTTDIQYNVLIQKLRLSSK
ncbi:MAG: sialate O-acetylesterase, partial [Candidatus Kapaibacterium sp.]